MTQPEPRVVHMRRGTGRDLGLMMVGGILATGFIVAMAASAGGSVTDVIGRAAPLLAVGAALLVVLALAYRPRPGAVWDLDRQTVTTGRRVVQFQQILRVIVCTGAKNYYGVLFFGPQGQLKKLSIPVGGRDDPPLAAWQAVRELLAAPHTPSLEGYGTPAVSARSFLTKPPRSATRGATAVRVLDDQIAWIASGRSPRAGAAPLEQFRVSGYVGP